MTVYCVFYTGWDEDKLTAIFKEYVDAISFIHSKGLDSIHYYVDSWGVE